MKFAFALRERCRWEGWPYLTGIDHTQSVGPGAMDQCGLLSRQAREHRRVCGRHPMNGKATFPVGSVDVQWEIDYQNVAHTKDLPWNHALRGDTPDTMAERGTAAYCRWVCAYIARRMVFHGGEPLREAVSAIYWKNLVDQAKAKSSFSWGHV